MAETSADTFFAPAGRDDDETLRDLAADFDHTHLFRAIVDAVPNPVAILNDLRQVVVANREVMQGVMTQRQLAVASLHKGTASLEEIGALPGPVFQLGLKLRDEHPPRTVRGARAAKHCAERLRERGGPT